MTYQEFKDTTIRAIQMKLGKNCRVAIQDIIKNNDTESDFYTKEYIDLLEDSLDELKFLIHLVSENGRIIWGIS